MRNAAGGGALEILLNRAIRDNCESLARIDGLHPNWPHGPIFRKSLPIA